MLVPNLGLPSFCKTFPRLPSDACFTGTKGCHYSHFSFNSELVWRSLHPCLHKIQTKILKTLPTQCWLLHYQDDDTWLNERTEFESTRTF